MEQLDEVNAGRFGRSRWNWFERRDLAVEDGIDQPRHTLRFSLERNLITGIPRIESAPGIDVVDKSYSRQPLEYAVDTYQIGYLPPLYLFDAMTRPKQHFESGAPLIVGDPDGSLPGARREARAVRGIIGGALLLGNDATLDAVRDKAPLTPILHLATHGSLVRATPEESWILLANKERLSVSEAAVLHLQETELVVLSACESGLSEKGMEYANLTYAFAKAGAPAMIATLWKIPDEPSSELMRRFYTHARDHHDRFTALAEAQREMIHQSENPAFAAPSAWAGYIPFGRP